MKIYVASSWRNQVYESVVAILRQANHEVYDCRKPAQDVAGFSWAEVDDKWHNWDFSKYKQALAHPHSSRGFNNDFNAMNWADACVMVLPAGRSANLELGWFIGKGKLTIVYFAFYDEPDLMYLACDHVVNRIDDVLLILTTAEKERARQLTFKTSKPCKEIVLAEQGACNLTVEPTIAILSHDLAYSYGQIRSGRADGPIIYTADYEQALAWLSNNLYVQATEKVAKLLGVPAGNCYLKVRIPHLGSASTEKVAT